MKRISQIDGLRAIASMLVVSFHYINNQLTDSKSFIGKLFAQLFSFGWAGVDLFFVLSGFLIGGILISNKTKSNYFSTFYIRRFVRIVPNYYLLIVLFVILCAIPSLQNAYFLTDKDAIPAWSYFTMFHNIFMAKLNTMGNSAMSVTWSIGIEEQFYLIIPFLIYFTNKKVLPYLLITFIILANVFRWIYITPQTPWIPAYVLLPCRMDAISFGVLLAWINNTYGIENFVKQHYKKMLFIMICIVLACAALFTIYKDIGVIRNTLFALFFACCIAIALGKTNSLYAKILSNKLLNWIGKISYSLYLFHYIILGFVKHLFSQCCNLQQPLNLFLASLIALVFSVLFSWLVYKFLETPTVALGKKFNYQ